MVKPQLVGAADDDEPDGDDSVGPAAAAADRSPTRIAAVFAGAAAAADHVAADLGTVHLKNLVVVKLQLKRMVLEPSAAGPAADAGTVHWRIQVVARLQLILEHAAALEDSIARVGASPSAPVLSVLVMPKTMAPTAAAVVVAYAAEAAVVAAGHYFPFEAP